jgi:hypothetical protein
MATGVVFLNLGESTGGIRWVSGNSPIIKVGVPVTEEAGLAITVESVHCIYDNPTRREFVEEWGDGARKGCLLQGEIWPL